MSMAGSTLEPPAPARACDPPEVVAGCRRNDPDYFSLFVRQAEPRAGGVLPRLVAGRHDVDELVQETYLRAWRRIAQFRGESRLSTWVLRIAVNVASNWRRDQKLVHSLRGEMAD